MAPHSTQTAERAAAVYFRSGTWYVSPLNETVTGLQIVSEPTLVVESSAEETELGSAMLRALSLSRVGVPYPASFKGLTDDILRAAALRSWSTFTKTATHFLAKDDGVRIRLVPSRRASRGTSFEYVPSQTVSLTCGASPSEIGRHLVELMQALNDK
jgi:hypothetical protein